MTDPQSHLEQQAALQALRNQQHHLEVTISRLLVLMKNLPGIIDMSTPQHIAFPEQLHIYIRTPLGPIRQLE